MERFVELLYLRRKNEYVYYPRYTLIILDAFKNKSPEEVIEFTKNKQCEMIIESFKDSFEFLRAEHQVIHDLEYENCLRLLSAYYFKKK